MTVDEYILLLEGCERDGDMNPVYYLIISLISADTMIDLKSCDRSIEELRKILKALKKAELGDELRRQLIDVVEKGIEIGEIDREML